MPNFTFKTRQEIEDFIRGATFYGTGGGGDPVLGASMMNTLLEEGVAFGWVDPREVGEDVATASVFGMGSTAPRTPAVCRQMGKYGLNPNQPLLSRKEYIIGALEQLENYVGKQVGALVPIELGGGNSPSAMVAAASKGIVMVDGDYAGRAVPEMCQTTVFLKKRMSLPMASCDCWGDRCIYLSAVNWPMVERMGKMFSVAGFGPCGMAGHWLSGKQMQDTVVPGTMTQCLEMGRLIREAREAGDDPVQAIAKDTGGWVLGRGVVSKREWEDRDGYFWGFHTIDGHGAYQGTQLRIMFQNENHICWQNGKPIATSPDLICVVDDVTGEPYINTVMKEGMRVAVIGLAAKPVFRDPDAVAVLGPRCFGLEQEYVPIEALVK